MPQPSTTPPQAYAFFDVDGTLVSEKTMFSFRDYCKSRLSLYRGIIGRLRYWFHKVEYWLSLKMGVSRERLNRVYYQKYRGVEELELTSLVAGWYAQQSKSNSFYILQTVNRFNNHRDRGLKTVLVSGSFELLLKSIIDQVGADYCLATRLETKNGVLTGKIIPPQTIGAGKSAAIQAFVNRHSVDLKFSYAYGDHHSDIPMLQQVGVPVAVSPDPVLLNHAKDKRWLII